MNVNVVDFKGVLLASSLNEKLRGKDTLESKDPSGKAFVKEFIATAQKGEGWVDYQFINPVSKKLEERSMFVKRAPGAEAFVAVATALSMISVTRFRVARSIHFAEFMPKQPR